MTAPRVIVNADDFGWTDGHNLAVEKAHCQGVLNRASLLCNGGAFLPAVELAQRLPSLQVGVHLTLNEGRPLLPPGELPNLARPDGHFHDELVPLLLLWLRGGLYTVEAQAEWQAQIESALAAGIHLSHLDSHKHVHLFPPLLQAIVELARRYAIPYVRLPLEPAGNALRRGPAGLVLWSLAHRGRRILRVAGLAFADHFVGFGASGAMTLPRLRQAVGAHPHGKVEIMVHPAVVTPAVATLQARYAWAARYRFEEELEALCAADPLPDSEFAAERVCR